MATIRDVAKLAGVSVTTVSAVLNTSIEDKKVALKTREKVNEAIRMLGYQPSIAARRLRGSNESVPVIAIFWPLDYRINMLGTVLKNMKSVVDQAYFKCELVVFPFKNDELVNYKDQFANEAFNGAFLGALSEADLEFLRSLDTNIPMVLYNRHLEKQHSVESDNQLSGKLAAQLLKESGCQEVVIFQYTNMMKNARQRLDSFMKACSENGIRIKEQVFLQYDNKEQTKEKTKKLADTDGLGDACIYCDELTAYASLFTMVSMGIRVPDEVKVLLLSTASNPMTSYVTPSITRVEYAIDDMLQECMRILIYSIQQQKQEEIHKIYEPVIVYGDTLTVDKAE